MNEYDLSDWKLNKKIATVVKDNYAKMRPTPVDQLIHRLKDPANSEHQRFLVKGYVLNFNHSKLEQIVKKVTEDGKVVAFNEPTTGPVTYIYHVIATLKDQSVESSEQSLPVYILTNEDDQHLFDLWEVLPGPKQENEWKKLKEKQIKEFENKLNGVLKGEVEVKMIVELLITATGKAFFKLYDTIFV